MNPEKFAQQARHTYGGTEGDKPSYLFEFTPDLTVYLLIGDDAMNAVITMRKAINGQDGYCGNFNCDADDDTMDKLTERGLEHKIGPSESMFEHVGFGPAYQQIAACKRPTLETCDPDVMAGAKASCASKAAGEMDGCLLEACATAPCPSPAVEAEAQRLNEANGFRFAGLITVPSWIQGTLAVALVGLFVAGVTGGLPGRRRRHRLYELAGVDENTERESSRTVRFGEASGLGSTSAPILERLRASAASAMAIVPSMTAMPGGGRDDGWDDDEEALLDGVAGEHEPI